MSPIPNPPPPVSRSLTALLLCALTGAAIYLFYGPGLNGPIAGWAAFLALPGAFGGLLAQFVDPNGDETMGCFVWPTLGIVIVIGAAWLIMGEGVICIVMILPFWVPAAIVGGLISFWNSRRRLRRDTQSATTHAFAWLLFPLALLFYEQQNPPVWKNVSVTREILIRASPERVWPLLLSVPGIKADEGSFNFAQSILRVPRPTEAILTKDSHGALVRRARWGAEIRFEERVVQIRPGREIACTFAFPDKSVELHTDRHISPNGTVLKIVSGRYQLSQIRPGITQVRLTTNYRIKTRLGYYLGWWGDRLLGDIQSNVLTIIRDRAISKNLALVEDV